MMTVMKANGMALEHVGEEMKGDRELCMAAVAQDGRPGNTETRPRSRPIHRETACAPLAVTLACLEN